MNLDTQLQILGYTAGGLIIISFIPQLVTIIQNKSSKNISIPMYFLLLIAEILWVSYSVLKNDMALLATNIGTAIITILIIGFSLYYKYTNDSKEKQLEMVSIEQV